jgi:hypothetical protein
VSVVSSALPPPDLDPTFNEAASAGARFRLGRREGERGHHRRERQHAHLRSASGVENAVDRTRSDPAFRARTTAVAIEPIAQNRTSLRCPPVLTGG